MNIIYISMLVSIITLIIVLFNNNLPQMFKIPSFFLGGKELSLPKNLNITKIPILIWLFIMIISYNIMLAYMQDTPQKQSLNSGNISVIIVDNSKSSFIEWKKTNNYISTISHEIFKNGNNIFALNEIITKKNQTIEQKYELIKINNIEELEKWFNVKFNNNPSPFVQTLVAENAILALKKDKRFKPEHANLYVITDMQKDSIQNFTQLKPLFSTIKIFNPKSNIDVKYTYADFIPKNLYEAWGGKTINSSFIFDNKLDIDIPEQAKPLWTRQKIQLNDIELVFLNYKNPYIKEYFPLYNFCSNVVYSGIEWDNFGDLRSILPFFQAKYRFLNCFEQNNRNESTQAWKYRRHAVWIIEIIEMMYNNIINDKKIILPNEYQNGDAIVFLASAREFINLNSVQLHENEENIMLYLAPDLTKDIVVNLEQNHQFINKNSYSFSPILLSFDGTILAHKMENLAIYYLRTTAVMPNHELSRYGEWVNFWINLSNDIKNSKNNNKYVEYVSASQFFTVQNMDELLMLSNYSHYVNPKTMDLQPFNFEQGFYAGLYNINQDYALFNVPINEESTEYINIDEYENNWIDAQNNNLAAEKNLKEVRYKALLGAIMATIFLSLFWLFKPQMIKIIFIGLILNILLNNKIYASTSNAVSFNISWCSSNIPKNLDIKYAFYKSQLEARGTIKLPDKILINECRIGMSEIWWTDNEKELNLWDVRTHLAASGFIIIEGQKTEEQNLNQNFASKALSLLWEKAPKRGMLYRSFYLLSSFDGCNIDNTYLLRLKKKLNAQAAMAIFTNVSFLSNMPDCFGSNEEMRVRSFVNLFYTILTTDYKEDHLMLPEILNRIRDLGLEP